MIKNQRQYSATKKQVDKLKTAIEVAHQTTVQMPKEIFEAMIAGIQSQIQEMAQELCEYDNLSKMKALPVDDFSHIGQMLIQTRIAKGLSQIELAEKCGLNSQQIQRYEETSYTSASLERLIEIVKALDVSFSAVVGFYNQPVDGLNLGWTLGNMGASESPINNDVKVQKVSRKTEPSWASSTSAESVYKIAC